MKNKSVQNCRFVHHAKFHCIMTTLNRLFSIEFEKGGGNWKRAVLVKAHAECIVHLRGLVKKLFAPQKFLAKCVP